MIQLRVLGGLELRREEGEELAAVLAQSKRLALLVYLALARPGRFYRRDELVALFWPEADAEHARAALRQALSFLRRELGEAVIVSRGVEEVGLAVGAVWCDAVELERRVAAGDGEAVAELCRGDLLPAFHLDGCWEFGQWLETKRGELARRFGGDGSVPMPETPLGAAGTHQRSDVQVDGASKSRTRGPRPDKRRWMLLSGGALLIGGFAVTVPLMMRATGLGPNESAERRELVIVADFENRTRDPLLGQLVTDLIRVDLTQSSRSKPLDGPMLAAALARMGRGASASVDVDLARQLTEREGAKAFVSGEVASFGSGFVLVAKVVSPAGEVLAAVREAASNENDLISAVDRVSAQLRERLGESRSDVNATEPLAEVTTASIDALRHYTAAGRLARGGDYGQAIAHLAQAVGTDTTFAMAYRSLAIALANVGGELSRRIEYATKAFHHRDRLSPLERHLVEGTYYEIVEPDRERATAAWLSALEVDPENVVALANLGEMYHDTRQYGKAEHMMLRVIELPADNAIVYRFAVSAQVFQGKFAAAETTIARAAARLPDNPDVVRMQARYAAARFDFEAATDLFSSLTRGGDGPDWVFAGRLGLADVALIQGRFREAEWHTREAMTLNEARGARRAYLAGAFYLADIHLMRGSSAAAVATIERALERFPPSAVTVADRLYLETVEVLARAGRISEARGVLDEFEREVESAGQRAEFRHRGASAAIALGEGRVEEAVDLLRRYRSQAPGALAGILELGQAYDRLGVRDSAVSYYEQFVNTPAMLPGAGGLMRPGWMGFIAPVLRRLGELYDEGGAESRALEHYRRFLQLWSNADPEFAGEITAARRRVAQLGATRASR